MKKILLIKTSSLGDVVHNFPALSDITAHFPNAVVDWVVEEAYAPLVRLHPGVRRAIPVAIRRWRGRPLTQSTWGEVAEFRRVLREERFDVILDSQGLIKSALLAAAAHGRRHGYDSACARESVAARFYDVHHHVARSQHAVARNRELAARALGYRCGAEVRYGLDSHESCRQEAQAVFLHSSSRLEKYWPEPRWIDLGRALEKRGLRVILPWGNLVERARSERLAAAIPSATVPEKMPLDAIATMLGESRCVVGVDTGLAHLAAAMGTPVVAIFCATDPRLYGLYGPERAKNVGGVNREPEVIEVIEALNAIGAL